MPDTWKYSSEKFIGYLAPMTRINERYVAIVKIQHWLNEGKTASQIALLWNQGNLSKCSSGVNDYGVKYDSCEYVRVVLAYYHQ